MSRFNRCCVTNCCRLARRVFSFPNPLKGRERFLTWLSNAGNPSLLSVPPNKIVQRYICEKHFEDRFFLGRGLMVHSVPTLYLPDPIDGTLYQHFEPPKIDQLPEVAADTETSTTETVPITIGGFTNPQQDETPQSCTRNASNTQAVDTSSILQFFRAQTKADLAKSASNLKAYNCIVSLKKQVSKLRSSKDMFKKRLQNIDKTYKCKRCEKLAQLPRAARQFFQCQVENVERNKFHRKFTAEDKKLAGQIWSKSAGVYQLLSRLFILPSESTVRAAVQSEIELSGGAIS